MDLNPGDLCSLSLSFNRSWKQVPLVRTFVQSFLTANFRPGGTADPGRVAMAVGELLENAVKYASGELVEVDLRIAAEGSPYLRLSVSNQATPEALRTVEDLYRRAMAGDPVTTYLEMMRESALGTEGHSRLGLIRIRVESGCNLLLESTATKVRFTLVLEGAEHE